MGVLGGCRAEMEFKGFFFENGIGFRNERVLKCLLCGGLKFLHLSTERCREVEPSEGAFHESGSPPGRGGCGSLSPAICTYREGEPGPFPPQLLPSSGARLAPASKPCWRRAGLGIGHPAPGTRARLPDVVILLVMESRGLSVCAAFSTY